MQLPNLHHLAGGSDKYRNKRIRELHCSDHCHLPGHKPAHNGTDGFRRLLRPHPHLRPRHLGGQLPGSRRLERARGPHHRHPRTITAIKPTMRDAHSRSVSGGWSFRTATGRSATPSGVSQPRQGYQTKSVKKRKVARSATNN